MKKGKNEKQKQKRNQNKYGKRKLKQKSKRKQTSKNQKAKTKQTNRFICFHCAYQWIVKLAYKEEFFPLNLLVFWKEA